MRGPLLLLALLALPLAAVAGDHPHSFQRGTCTDWSEPVKGCQHRMCPYRCTYPGCSHGYTLPETRGCEGGGRFGGAGASGEYSAAPPAAVPLWEGKGGKFGGGGATGSYETCPPGEHDFGDERCGPWHEIKPGCKVRHCTRQCQKCRTNGRDRMDDSPSGCF